MTSTSEKYSFFDFGQKPIEIYVFIDPLCPKCWSLEPYLKKLSIEYGRFFTIRPIISSPLRTLKKEIKKNDQKENHVSFPWVGLAIKAAELQGNNAGRAFLRKIQVNFFLKNKDISDNAVLTHCATEANLDVQEFKKDIFSEAAKKAFQCDLKLKKEMDVEDTPTIVFFNHMTEDQGIKISGIHSYHIYVQIFSEMLQYRPIPAVKPPLKDFLAFYNIVSSQDVSVVYDWTAAETERKLKMLQLKQIAKKIPVKQNVFWKYIDNKNTQVID